MNYYSRQGRPITFDEWVAAFDNMTYEARRVAFTVVDHGDDDGDGRIEVSTVWLGLNHAHGTAGPPLIFETLVFGGAFDGELWRYSTEAQAIAGHDHAVTIVRAACQP